MGKIAKQGDWSYDPWDHLDGDEAEAWDEFRDHVLSPLLDGRRLVCRGTESRWDGTSSGGFVCDGADGVVGELYRMGAELISAWTENGSLHLRGFHHDGSIEVEVRILAPAALREYEEHDGCAWELETERHRAWFDAVGELSLLPAA